MLPVLIQYWRELFSGISSPLDLSDESKFKGKKNINFKRLITFVIAFSEQHFYAVLVLHLFCPFLVCYDRKKSCTRFFFLLEHSFLTSAVPMHFTIFFWVKKQKMSLELGWKTNTNFNDHHNKKSTKQKNQTGNWCISPCSIWGSKDKGRSWESCLWCGGNSSRSAAVCPVWHQQPRSSPSESLQFFFSPPVLALALIFSRSIKRCAYLSGHWLYVCHGSHAPCRWEWPLWGALW